MRGAPQWWNCACHRMKQRCFETVFACLCGHLLVVSHPVSMLFTSEAPIFSASALPKQYSEKPKVSTRDHQSNPLYKSMIGS